MGLFDSVQKASSPSRTSYEAARAATYWSGYPSGWYRILDSTEIKSGQVKHVQRLGRDFAVLRSDVDNTVSVLDAHCPHMGTNLGLSTKVRGGCIECPLHKWRFDTSGRVKSIPYSKKIPGAIRTPTWPVRELHGMICVYYDAGDPGATTKPTPPYSLEPLPEIVDGTLKYRGTHRFRNVRMNIAEFAENSADQGHFAAIHGNMQIPWTTRGLPGIKVDHHASWESDPEHSHIAYFKNHARLNILGRPFEKTATDAVITFFGPGSFVWFRFEVPSVGDIVVFQTHTPIEPNLLDVRFHWFAHKAVSRFLTWYVVGSWVGQWRNDIEIWENKVFRDRPMLVAGDGPVHEMRRWYSQFYPNLSAGKKSHLSAKDSGM